MQKWQDEHLSDREPASLDMCLYSDVYKGLPILPGHFSLKEKASHFFTRQELKTHFGF